MTDLNATAAAIGSARRRRAYATQLDAELEQVLEALDRPVAVLDGALDIVAVNAAWRAAADAGGGVARGEVGETYFQATRWVVGDVGGPTILTRAFRALVSGEQPSFSRDYQIGRDGTARHWRVRVSRIAERGPARFLVMCEDVTELIEARNLARELREQMLGARSEERELLGAELHDSVGQDLACLGLCLSRLRLLLPKDEAVLGVLAEMAESLQDANARIRTTAYLLHPPWSDDHGPLQKTIQEFVQGFGRRAGLGVRVTLADLPSQLDADRELALFRILQEALLNINRHAHASTIEVELSGDDREVRLAVRDDGRGFPAVDGGSPVGVGISGMRARVRQFGGELEIRSGQEGTTLKACLPLGDDLSARRRASA